MEKGITALIILDGYGIGADKDNAIAADGSKYISEYKKQFPNTSLKASGLAVGLPEGQMGNSEVGHLNIGAGRIVYQELTRITKSVEDGDFFENPALLAVMESALAKGTKLHLMGLCSDGGVHSTLEHCYALLRMAKAKGLERVYVHCFMDGRDVPPSSGANYLEQLEEYIGKLGVGSIATVMGRYYAMDRDNRYERVQKAYDALAKGLGARAKSAVQAAKDSYREGVTDEFILPAITDERGVIEPGDGVVFFNFRPDRARELTRAFMQPDFTGFERRHMPLEWVCMTQYDLEFGAYPGIRVAFAPQHLDNTLGEYASALGLRQLRIAETEKYAHVTFFFNGGVEEPNAGEDRVLIPSPKVATYDLKPQMSAYEVAQEAVKRVNSRQYQLMILNFANSDMVGHTGVMSAATAAVHAVDECVHQVVEAIREAGGRCFITADHGNADLMVDPISGGPFTAHTTNPVPFIYVDDKNPGAVLREGGVLADIAPTLLTVMGIQVPEEMTGKSIV